MRLVVDTNRLIAALVKNSYSRRVLLSDKFDFYSVALLRRELAKYEGLVLKKSGLEKPAFNRLVEALLFRISVVDDALVEASMPAANSAMKNVDPFDSPFLAAALAVKADGVWSDDPHFLKQNLVKVFLTKELVPLL